MSSPPPAASSTLGSGRRSGKNHKLVKSSATDARPPRHHSEEERKRRRAVQGLVVGMVSATSNPETAGFSAEALICSFPRFVSSDIFLHILKRLILHESLPERLLVFVKLLAAWVRLRGTMDFRRGSKRLESLLRLMNRIATRGPVGGIDPFGETLPLHIELNRVKLALISSLCRHPSNSSVAATPLAPASPKVERSTTSSSPSLSFKRNPIAARPTALKLFSFSPTQIAEDLTLIDHQIFSEIPLEDFLEKRWEDKSRPSKLRDMIERSNNISDWVASHVLVQSTVAAQVHVVEQFLEVGKWCESLGNYFACSGIFGGFSKWCISRLTRTWKIKHGHKLLHAHLHLTVSEEKNYATYRGLLAERVRCSKPCVPHLGVFLRDLTFVEDGNPDFVNDTPNVKKIALVGDIIEQIQTLQTIKYSTKHRSEDVFLQNRLRMLPRRDDAWLEKRSTELRPMAPAGSAEDLSFLTASTKSEESSEDKSFLLEEVGDLSDASSQSGGTK